MKYSAFFRRSSITVQRIGQSCHKFSRATVCCSAVLLGVPVMSDHVFLATTLARYSARLLRHSVKMAELLYCAIG